MRDFNTMTFSEISAEMERFQLQIIRQQANKIPLTQRQINYYKALSNAYKKINREFAN